MNVRRTPKVGFSSIFGTFISKYLKLAEDNALDGFVSKSCTCTTFELISEYQ